MSSRGRPPGLTLQIVGLTALAGLASASAAVTIVVWPERAGPGSSLGPLPVLALLAATLALVLILALVVSRRLARHVRAIQRGLEAIASGRVPGPVPPGPAAEMDDLGHALSRVGSHPELAPAGVRRGDASVPAQEVGRLSGALADELSGPLARLRSLAGPLEAVRRPEEEGPPSRRLTLLIEVARLQATVRRLRALAGDVSPRPVSVRLNAAVQVCVDAMQPVAAAAGCSLSFDPDPNLGLLRLDPDVLHRILVPILRRALQASRAGRVDVRTQTQAGEALVAVRDEGGGVPPSLERLFDPLEAPHDAQPALELAACARLARAHGGALTAVSLHPRGLELCLRLPAAAG